MSDVIDQIEAAKVEADAELKLADDPSALEQFRIKFLGSKGRIKALMKLLGQVPKDQKPGIGQKVNALRDQITAAFESRKSNLVPSMPGAIWEDVTEPGTRRDVGNLHILMKVQDELTELFGRMGFAVASGPEVEDEFHNFVALNIPQSHPARDPLDNFYLSEG
ncbi:MAG: phenylalanine--tRNA ligase subunit alpha, partial [Tepidisphaeraceae bacterium]